MLRKNKFMYILISNKSNFSILALLCMGKISKIILVVMKWDKIYHGELFVSLKFFSRLNYLLRKSESWNNHALKFYLHYTHT